MDNHDYKIKVEYGVSAVVLLIGLFFLFQAFTIDTSREIVGPRTMPMILAVATILSGLWLAIRAITGRAGATGVSISFASEDDAFLLPDLEALLGSPLECTHPPKELLS